jgi:Flp pilus assembly protein TadD
MSNSIYIFFQSCATDTSNYHAYLAQDFYNKGDYERAIREYKESLRLNPNDSRAHNNLIACYVNYANKLSRENRRLNDALDYICRNNQIMTD